jgi:predicted nucleic acid-binding protein
VNVVDSSGWLKYLADGPNADFFAPSIQSISSLLYPRAARISHDEKIPMADSVMLASARAFGATLWSQDSDFENISDVKYIAKR